MLLNVAIIEDEPAIARNLDFMLNEIGSINVLKKLSNIHDSVDWLRSNIERCDLLFMDIRLTDGLSFDIFKHITPSVPIVFITAYDNYAIEAFKVNGIDYILKPFEKDHLVKAINKFDRIRGTNIGDSSKDKIKDLLKYLKEKDFKETYKKAYLVHYQKKLIPLNVDKIHWFYTTDEIVFAYTAEGSKYVIDSTLERIQSELSATQFFRVNRQFIIQRKAIKDIDFYFNGRLLVNVFPKPEEKIIISKAKAPEFKKWMNQ